MNEPTRSQKLAQAAYDRIAKYGKPETDYVSFAKKFPALIHTCGLAQAVAFADAKRKKSKPGGGPECLYLEDLAAVLKNSEQHNLPSGDTLKQQTRELPLSGYLRLSRDALDAASWLKRYVEAAGEDD